MNELNYINSKLSGKEAESPQFVYKYRPFDKFTFDMLDKGYVYLCPANLLDDPSECIVDFSYRDIYDAKSGLIKFKLIELILEQVRPFTSEENYNKIRDIVRRTTTPDGLIKRNYLLDASFEMQELALDIDMAPIVNLLGNLPKRLDEPKTKESVENMLELAYMAREGMGICSLSELKNSEEMWRNYASNSSGYCIEYDIRQYKHLPLLYPAIYTDFRETNIVRTLMAEIVGEVLCTFSQGKLNADRSQYVQLFLTKDTKWAYQKEWRILGEAEQHLSAPKINSIILGRNMSEENKTKMIFYCKNHNIVVNLN